VADRLGDSRFTVADLERGRPGSSAAAYLGALWVLGLLGDARRLGDPDRDEEGKALEWIASMPVRTWRPSPKTIV